MQQAKDLSEFLRLLNLDSVTIIGKSDGAIVALMMGIYYPSRLKKIVSFAANIVPDSTALYPKVLNTIHEERMQAEAMITRKDTSQNWRMARFRLRLMEFQPHLTASDLKRINVPVLVMSCDRDVIKTEHTIYIYNNIRRAHLCILNGETHHVPRKDPEAFNAPVYRFISQAYKDESERFKK
jgi:pimeloyl-ACP methyl ester carboxylesterase